jgi:hypothetical protein
MSCGLELGSESISCGAYKTKAHTMRFRKKEKGIACLIGAGLLALSALPQVALGTLSDSMTVQDGNGNVLASRSISEQDEMDNPNGVWIMPGDVVIANAAQWGHATAVYEEGSTIGDVFGVVSISDTLASGTYYYLAFMSAPDSNPDSDTWSAWLATAEDWFGAQNTWSYVTETAQNGGSFDASQYLDPGVHGSIQSATFWSTVVVPEPTTMIAGALLLLPFGASTLRILRKRQMA